MMALNPNKMAKRHCCGFDPRQAAEKTMVRKLPQFTHAASRVRYLPRTASGTRDVIHGSHAQLEMPRERLKQNRNINMSASRVELSRNDRSGTNAIRKINMIRVPHPPSTNFL